MREVEKPSLNTFVSCLPMCRNIGKGGKGEATPTLTIAGGSPLLTMSMLCLMHTKGKVFSGNLLAGDVEIYS